MTSKVSDARAAANVVAPSPLSELVKERAANRPDESEFIQLNIRAPRKLRTSVKALAEKLGVTYSDLCLEWIRQGFSQTFAELKNPTLDRPCGSPKKG